MGCKGIKATVATITKVVTKVAPYLSAVPIVGKIAKAMAKGLKLLNKAVQILTKVFHGLEKVDRIVQKAKETVTKAKDAMDNEDYGLKTRSDEYYDAFGYVYRCKQQVCNNVNTLDSIVAPPQKFHQMAKIITRQCADTLKPLNDGPLSFWIQIKPLIDALMKILEPIFDTIEEIFDAVNDFVAKLGEALNTVKCCLPGPLQTLLNLVTAVVDLLFCPINGLIDGRSETFGSMIKQAVMNLASKLVPNIKFEIGGWTVLDTRLNAHWNLPHVCTHNHINFNIDYTVGWAGWSIDTSIVDNAGAETPSMSQIGQEVLNSIQNCAKAVSSFGDVHKTCDCPIQSTKVTLGGTEIKVTAGCFPAEAMVVTPQGKKQISELKVGDCVLSKRADGSVDTCDEVYMFGHAEHGTSHLYHKLSLSSGSSIHLTNKHFIHTSKSSAPQFKRAVLKYAEDVSVGDWIWGANGEASQVYTVERVVLKGAFNPYTTSGNIIVDEVVASAHSEWFLDEAVPRSVTRYLPAIYQSILSLNRVLHLSLLYHPRHARHCSVWRHERNNDRLTLHCLEARGMHIAGLRKPSGQGENSNGLELLQSTPINLAIWIINCYRDEKKKKKKRGGNPRVFFFFFFFFFFLFCLRCVALR